MEYKDKHFIGKHSRWICWVDPWIQLDNLKKMDPWIAKLDQVGADFDILSLGIQQKSSNKGSNKKQGFPEI